ncbi:MAG TPA: hypothetical protein VG387_12845 [Rhizomicrobium sp.]|jgi:hypothetical protein|nr:hypothetical protein [Rhizomicrobium sp.]
MARTAGPIVIRPPLNGRVGVTGFRRWSLRRGDIAGYRLSIDEDDDRSYQLELTGGTRIDVDAILINDRDWRDFAGPLPELNEREREARRKAFENDPALGATADDRARALRRLRLVARIANGVGVAGALLLLFGASDARLLVAIAAMPPARWRCSTSRSIPRRRPRCSCA